MGRKQRTLQRTTKERNEERLFRKYELCKQGKKGCTMDTKAVYELFDRVMEKVVKIEADVAHIKEQTTKTNGRVTELEKGMNKVRTWKVAAVVAFTLITLVLGWASATVSKGYETLVKLQVMHQGQIIP
jgi:hypothetical protein